MIVGRGRMAGGALLALMILAAAAAPALATHDTSTQFSDYVLAPPMMPRILDSAGALRAPFVYPLRLEDRLSRTFSLDRAHPEALRWLHDGKLVTVAEGPWFPLGTDSLGRDVFARLIAGGRLSLGVAAVAAAASLALGALIGGLAGVLGGRAERLLMAVTDFVIALPGIYVALTLRAALPLVLSNTVVFWAMAGVLTLIGWPLVARGVRGIVAAENHREYAEAARASGSTRMRILRRHLLPATRGFLAVQATLLIPAFILAEATLSYVGLGFDVVSPSWGAMLRAVDGGRLLAEAPWLLTPAIAIAITVLSVNLLTAAAAKPIPALNQPRN